jgi:probable F420-dependent oxidoreductase
MFDQLGQFGVFRRSAGLSPEFAAAREGLGYGAIWIGGSPDGDLQIVDELLEATSTLMVATGIVNIWKDAPEPVAASYHRLEQRYPGRFLLGIGVGHPEAITDYSRPFEALVRYLDALDEAKVPVEGRLLAALRPKVLKLSADRSAGAHPYLTTPEHTRRAREILGADALLAPEQKVVLETDPERARSLGRPVVDKPYLGLVNYTNNLRWLGYDDADFADGGSDRLIDALVLHGETESIATGLRQHLEAGADHVPINLITPRGADAMAGYTALAKALFA